MAEDSAAGSPKERDRDDMLQENVIGTLQRALAGGGRTLYGIEVNTVASLFAAIDKDGSGEIESKELREALQRFDMKLLPEQLSTMMGLLDTDKSETIDFPELAAAFRAALAAELSALSAAALAKRASAARIGGTAVEAAQGGAEPAAALTELIITHTLGDEMAAKAAAIVKRGQEAAHRSLNDSAVTLDEEQRAANRRSAGETAVIEILCNAIKGCAPLRHPLLRPAASRAEDSHSPFAITTLRYAQLFAAVSAGSGRCLARSWTTRVRCSMRWIATAATGSASPSSGSPSSASASA